MPRRNMRSPQAAIHRTRRVIAPPNVPVRSLDPAKSDDGTDAAKTSKPKAPGDTVDENVRRMIEAAYT